MKQCLKFLIVVLLSFGCESLYAQLQGQAQIDSILKELPKQKEDINKANLLNSLAYDYYVINPDEGIKYGQQALDLSTRLNSKIAMADAYYQLGVNYFNKSDNQKALFYFGSAFKMYTELKNKNGLANATTCMGNVCLREGDYDKALEYYLQSLKMNEDINNKPGQAIAMNNIGGIYNLKSQHPRALEYYLKALKIDEAAKDNDGMGNDNGGIGNVYSSQNDYAKALEFYTKALKMAEITGNKLNIAGYTENIGSVYEQQKDYAKALEAYFRSLKICEEIGNKDAIAENTGNIGHIYIKQKNYAEAIKYEQQALIIDKETSGKSGEASHLLYLGESYLSLVTDTPGNSGKKSESQRLIPKSKSSLLDIAISYLVQGLVIGKEIHAPEIIKNAYELLMQAYKLKGDYKKALEAADNYRIIKDSVFSAENDKKILQLGMKNEYDRQRFRDSVKTEEKEKIAHLQLQRQKGYTYIGVAGILLLVCFSFFIAKERGKSEMERKKSDDLLLNILPGEVANELKINGTTTAKHYEHVTVMFTDFVNFTNASERMNAQLLIDELHTCFKTFDEITAKYGIEKIKTIGDAYLAVAGLPAADPKHAENIVKAAIEINAFMQDRVAKLGNSTFQIRIGIHSGSVVAGIVGVKKFAYDIWGDTVNTAARMEQNSEAGRINISQTTYELVKDKFSCEYRGEIEAKGKGQLRMYFVS